MLAKLPSPLRRALLRLGRDELEALVSWGQERVAYFDQHPEDDPGTWPEDERSPPIPAAELKKLVLTADRRKRRGSKARRVADDYPGGTPPWSAPGRSRAQRPEASAR